MLTDNYDNTILFLFSSLFSKLNEQVVKSRLGYFVVFSLLKYKK